MNLVMISQTAQCWSIDGLFKRFEVGEQEFDFWHQKMSVLTMFVCYHHAVRGLNYSRCVKKKSRILVL